MNFDDLVANVCDALRREQRISYRALRRRFGLSDNDLADLMDELIHAKQWAIDEDHRVLVWTGETDDLPAAPSPSHLSAPLPTVALAPPVRDLSTPVEPRTSSAERRQLTVMFCDLVNSTALSGQLDPEDLRDVIQAYQATCTEVVQRYDGYVAQYLGDGLLVYFGYPQAHEDDAQRAVRAGLDMLEALGQLNTLLEQKRGVRLAARLGVHTGRVVVGAIGIGGRQESLALGDTPNIAARVALSTYLTIPAEVCMQVGELEEALSLLIEALRLVEATGERYWVAEMRRLQGEYLIQASPDKSLEAEERFHQALEIARRQQTKSLELRAAISLSRLWRRGPSQAAYDLLAPVYGRFTEGLDTADLIAAKSLLDVLA